MKKGFIWLIILLMLSNIIAISACDESTTEETNEPTTRVITDLAGNIYTIPTPENIERAGILHTPIVQNIYIVGAGDKLCALSPQSQKWWLLQKMDPRVEDMPAPRQYPGNINMEELIASDPDLCIGMTKDADTVNAVADFPCLSISTDRGSDPYLVYQEEQIRFFGRVFGKETEAENYCSYLEDVFSMIQTETESVGTKLKVLYAGGTDYTDTYGIGSYMSEWIELAGCENVVNDIENSSSRDSYMELSTEQMLTYDPDIILIDSNQPEDMMNDSVWSELDAVKNGKVYRVPIGMFIWNRPCAEGAAQFPEWLALTAYPDLFPGLTMEDEVARFFDEIFNYTLSEEDINTILHPTD